MLWTNPFLLFGLASLAGPIVIHLCMKAKARRVAFSTLRFFPPVQPRNRNNKVRHWLLLLLRLLILALIVAGFARPFWPSAEVAAPATKPSRAVAILLDCSASMQALSSQRDGKTCWQSAVADAGTIIAGLSEKDRVAIITSAAGPRIVTPWSPPATATDSLRSQKVTNEAGRLADGLRQASILLEHAPEGFQRELIIISDLQKTSCKDLGTVSVPEGTHYQVMSTHGPGNPNIAVEDVQPGTTAALTLKVRLRNFSSDRAENLPLSLTLDRGISTPVPAPILVNLEGNGTALTDLPVRLSPGWHDIVLELKHPDVLSVDNIFYAALNVPEQVHVVVVAPDLDAAVYRRSSYFVISALDPNEGAEKTGAFAVSVVPPTAPPALPIPGVVILPPLAEPRQGIGAALKNYVEQGGGLLLWTGPNLDMLGYDREFSGILPARFIGIESDNDVSPGEGWKLGSWDIKTPIFDLFTSPAQGNLALPVFHQRLKLEPHPDSEVLAAYDDHAPFILQRKVGRGRVLLVNTSPDKAWSDWPAHRTFLPVVHQMTMFLAGNAGENAPKLASSKKPTQDSECDAGPAHAGNQLKIVGPDGKIAVSQADESGLLHHLDCEALGVYEVRNAQDKVLQRFCVNFPASESSLEAWNAGDIAGMLRFHSADRVALENPLLSPNVRFELWPWLLSLAVVLLFLEVTWANRIKI